MVHVARAVTKRFISVAMGVGSRLPMYCTALGRALLASLPEERLAAELAKVDLVPHTRLSVTSRQRLEEILVEVRRQGYAVNDQELEIGLRAIAVPVRDALGETVAAMNVSAEASRVSRRELIDVALPRLRTAAQRLGQRLTDEAGALTAAASFRSA